MSLGDHLSSIEIAAMLRVCIGRLDRLEAEAKKEVKKKLLEHTFAPRKG
jgi:DNA-directed RNA polymerase specialized sigma24 family protein